MSINVQKWDWILPTSFAYTRIHDPCRQYRICLAEKPDTTHTTIQESDVRRYIQEGNTIRANIDGFVGGLNAVADPETPVKKAPPVPKKEEPEKKAVKPEIPRNTDVIDAVNKAMAQQKKAAKK